MPTMEVNRQSRSKSQSSPAFTLPYLRHNHTKLFSHFSHPTLTPPILTIILHTYNNYYFNATPKFSFTQQKEHTKITKKKKDRKKVSVNSITSIISYSLPIPNSLPPGRS